ncbi:MAG: WYL domain-containing protein [Gammaproteobacteria bacterium]|nr:WYL domain-containing protein [Gammaproteobacteria bacterium]
MVSKEKMHLDVKWATRQRLQYIEVMAYYSGVVTRTDVVRAFDISAAAATKDLKLYSQLAPNNLLYKHQWFGFVPSASFQAVFADLSPSQVVPLLGTTLGSSAGPPWQTPSLYGINVDNLPLPNRLPDKQVVAQITRAIKSRQQLRAVYYSLSDRDKREARILEPHALVTTGLRWHVRAYSLDTYDFRDFVLSRFVEATCLDQPAESSAQYDDEWVELLILKLSPHPRLAANKRASLMIDYGGKDDIIEVTVRRALIGYLLQQLSVDTSADHSLNPHAYPLIVVNRDEVEPFAGWAFHS